MTQHATPGGTVTEPHIEWEVVTKAELKRLREEHHELRMDVATSMAYFLYCPCGWAHISQELDEHEITRRYQEHLT